MKSRKHRRDRNEDHRGGYEAVNTRPYERLNMDDVADMQDEELITRLDSLHENRGRCLKARVSAKAWEEEICYIRRELSLRRDRRGTHEAYVKQVEADMKANQRAERSLPAADLDNSRFMFLG